MPGLRIIRHPGSSAPYRRGAVLAMGNFDGLHKGHAALIGHAGALARDSGVPVAVLTFEPHPRNVFLPGCEPFRLTPFRVKEREIARLGVDLLFIQHFDAEFAKQSAESFIDEVMVGAIGTSHVVVGHDCTFGNRRRGTAEMLREHGAAKGFSVTVVEPVRGAGAVYSSTHIRELLTAGNPPEAAAQLGRFWEIDGRVALGDQRGRTISFPGPPISASANICVRPSASMRCGYRATGPTTRSAARASTASPISASGLTVGGLVPRLEAHLFDISRDLYGRHLTQSGAGRIHSPRAQIRRL